MSALRINVPGMPVVLVDQGPARAHTSGHGGELVTPLPMKGRLRDRTDEYARTAKRKADHAYYLAHPEKRDAKVARQRERRAEERLKRELAGDPRPNTSKCGAAMRYGSCARRVGHRDSHRTADIMRDDAARRRGAYIPDIRAR